MMLPFGNAVADVRNCRRFVIDIPSRDASLPAVPSRVPLLLSVIILPEIEGALIII